MNEGLKTWVEVRTWDDVVRPDEKRIISELDFDGPKCPYLGKLGNSFCYCKVLACQFKQEGFSKVADVPNPHSPQYQAKMDVAELQLWCLQDRARHKKCIFFSELDK